MPKWNLAKKEVVQDTGHCESTDSKFWFIMVFTWLNVSFSEEESLLL